MTEQEAMEKLKRTSVLWESATNTEMVEAVKVAIKSMEEVQQYLAIGTVDECRAAVEKINYYQNLLGKKVWWIDAQGNRVESVINCFYIEDGIEGVRCEFLNCTGDAAEIGKSIHVIN